MHAQQRTAAPELAAFLAADADRPAALFHRLVGTVRSTQGQVDAAAADELVDEIRHRLPTAAADRRAYLVFLLGFLVHMSNPEQKISLREKAREGLDHFLELLEAEAAEDESARVALLYLLAQFPADRERILERAGRAPLSAAEWSRLRRCLTPLDPDDPVLGRAWPSPAGWRLTEQELAADRTWARGLDRDRVDFLWDKDTRTVLAYCGGRAYAALSTTLADETPAPVVTATEAEPTAGVGPIGLDVALLRCPNCAAPLHAEPPLVVCVSCARTYDSTPGFLDLSGESPTAMDQIAGNSPLYLHRYETLLRPAFLRITGANWDDAVSVTDEDSYLAEHLRSASGPVLDLAAGAGRWTEVVARTVGAEHTIAMDLASAMVARLRRTLPDVASLRGSAENIPFRDGTIGAISCWNALQSMDDPALAIREVGRCLRPGGVFTLLTFVTAEDPVYRFFQAQHENCLTVRSFPIDELHGMLADAGLSIKDERVSGTLVMLTAVRDNR